MDDQRNDRTGSRIMQMLRLVALMLVGAGIGSLPRVGNIVTVAEERIPNSIFGALCGLGVEMVVRALSKK